MRTGSALVDQVLSSGSGLVVLVLVAHQSSAATIGSVGLALIVNGFLLGCVRAVVGEVALIRARRPGSDERFETATALALAVIGAAVASSLLLAVAVALQNETGRYLTIVAVALPFIYVQDVLRYVHYSARRIGEAIVIDGAWLAVQVVLSASLIATDRASATVLLGAWALGGAVGALLGLVRVRVGPERRGIAAWWAEDRRRMASFLTDYAFSTGLVQASFLVLGVALSRAEFGTFRLGAVAVSPLANAMAGVRVLGLARLADRRGDADAALRTASRYGAAFTAAGLGYLALLALLPDRIGIALIGSTWTDARTIALITAAGEALRLGSFAATDFVKVFARGVRLVRTRAVVSVLVVVGALVGGTSTAGPEGAATGIALASLVGTVLWWLTAARARNDELHDDHDLDVQSAAVMGLGWRSSDLPLTPAGGVPTAESPLRIVHVVARSHLRGAEKVALELGEELDELGHRNRVVAIGLGQDGGRVEGLDVLVDDAQVRPQALVGAAWRLRRQLRAEPVDVVLAHGGWALQVAMLAVVPRWGRHAPLVVWQRILGVPQDLWQGRRRWLWRVLARRIDAAVALTGDLEEEMRRLGFDGAVWVIPNARRPEKFLAIDRPAASARLHHDLGLAPGVPIIGFVGHLVAQKRPERTVQVLAGVRSAGIPAHLVIAGDGPLREDLEAEVERYGLGEHVTLLGFRIDVEEVMGASDVLLMTSDAEGIPGVAIESLMTGCPMVTFPLGGVAEVVVDGETGVVLDRFDTVLMARRVAELLSDREALEQMGAEGRSRSEEFAFSRVAATYASQLLALRDGLVPVPEHEVVDPPVPGPIDDDPAAAPAADATP
jgi:glycosyltransferase involved in cell wall biosynthesis